MYEKLKKQNGEKFAQTLRNFHNGLLEIHDLDVIVRHAGQDAEPLLPYLMSLLASNDDIPVTEPGDPFVLLDRAGYDAFYADTLEKQNNIKHYFAAGELLCTFNDSARYQKYHIVHAVKKDADKIRRQDFKGNEQREDEYGTSVISIQMLKTGGFISIKNRYNHAVDGCDNTFNSNPDNIIQGLSAALKDRFDVEFSASKSALPGGFVLMGNRIFKYYTERSNTYYGHDAWAKDGTIYAVDKSAGDALFDQFLYENKTKRLRNISHDTFANDFNRSYGGNRTLRVQNGNLTLNGEILIGAEQSRIKTLTLRALTTMGNNCLASVNALTYFEAPALTTMGEGCLYNAHSLTYFEAPALTAMGDSCLYYADALTYFEAPALTTMADRCLRKAPSLTCFEAPALTTIGESCLHNINALIQFKAPALTTMANDCVFDADSLTQFEIPALTAMGDSCLFSTGALTHFRAPALITMGSACLLEADALIHFEAPALIAMGGACLCAAATLKHFEAPALVTMGESCLKNVNTLTHIEAPALKTKTLAFTTPMP